MDLRQHIRDIPDHPQPGILFRDITPLLQNPDAFRYAVEEIAARFEPSDLDAIAGVESRGFLFAAPLAYELGLPLVIVRKQGKLPFHTHSQAYTLEYGEDALEVHVDSVAAGSHVLIADDLLATGGTLAATAKLIERAGGVVAGLGVVIELRELRGRDALAPHRIESLITY